MVSTIKSYLSFFFCFMLFALLVSCSLGDAGKTQVDRSQKNEEVYRLIAGDTISIVVFGEPELTIEAELSESGTIVYPYLGKVSLLNKSLEEARVLLVDGLSDGYLVDPKVSITVDSYKEIYVGGEVVAGGNFPFQPGLTVGKAIVLARGFTERAARTRIFVTSERVADGEPVRVSKDYVLKPGDVVTVQRRFF